MHLDLRSLWTYESLSKMCKERRLMTHHPFQNFSKDDMFAVQPGSSDSSDKELGTVGVFASIGHAEPARAIMLQLEVLIGEPVSIDALS